MLWNNYGTSKITKYFGINTDIATKTKENIYKIVIAATELAKKKTGALIVIERDIKLKDIAETGIIIEGEISPQLLVNIFNPKTPLHDGAVIISENKIKAAACMLPLSNDKNISKGLGTRHRSACRNVPRIRLNSSCCIRRNWKNFCCKRPEH